MTEPRTAAAPTCDSNRTAPTQAAHAEPDRIVVTPAVGLLPPIYLPAPGESGPAGPLWPAAQTVRRAMRWVTRQQRRNDV
jgi:hypothetical protein